MKNFLIFCLVFLANAASAQQKPNIIYILADDLGYGDVSCLNSQSAWKTPHIDALAREGMLFTDAHSGSAVCTPTRYGILTGRYSWRTPLQNGVLWSYDSMLIRKNRATVASLLKNAGYQTACIGKWHLGLDWQKEGTEKVALQKPLQFGPTDVGFDFFYGIAASLDIPPYVYIQNNRVTAHTIGHTESSRGKAFWREGPIGDDFQHDQVLTHLNDRAIEYIKTASAKKEPFFLYYPLTAPHTPILPSRKWLGKSGTTEYGDFVLMVDELVGEIVQTVKDAGIEDETLIIFTSDNGFSPAAIGEELLSAGHNPSYVFRGAKADIYEGGHRIPFIVKWPQKITPNSQTTKTVCLTDLMATAANITGQPLQDNEGEDSYSLLPLLLQQGNYKRPYTIHHSIDGNFAIRNGKWKLIYAYGSGGWSAPTEKAAKEMNLPPVQLYDLESDIGETKNVASLHPEVVNTLGAALQQIVESGRSTPGKEQHNDVKVDFRKL